MNLKSHPSGNRGDNGWTIERAEALLESLTGIVSVRIVAAPGGAIQEIHVLTSDVVAPKQTVRNVESALAAHFDLHVDHRKISVAQSAESFPPAPPGAESPSAPTVSTPRLVQDLATAQAETRILFQGHQIHSERAQRVRMKVSVEWRGNRFDGDAEGPDLPRPRLEAVAHATLRAIEGAVKSQFDEGDRPDFHLSLDGVKQIDAFERSYVLVAVHALSGREVTSLAGASHVEDSLDRSVILSTLQATDRWVRGRI
jgi:hypothetical protein